MIHACARPRSVTGNASGWTTNISAPAPDERDDVGTVVGGPQRGRAPQAALVDERAPVDGRALGEALADGSAADGLGRAAA